MYAAARFVRAAVSRSGSYAVRWSVYYVSEHDLTLTQGIPRSLIARNMNSKVTGMY